MSDESEPVPGAGLWALKNAAASAAVKVRMQDKIAVYRHDWGDVEKYAWLAEFNALAEESMRLRR